MFSKLHIFKIIIKLEKKKKTIQTSQFMTPAFHKFFNKASINQLEKHARKTYKRENLATNLLKAMRVAETCITINFIFGNFSVA